MIPENGSYETNKDSTAPDADFERRYYDAAIGGKLEGFVEGNPRVELAAKAIAFNAPRTPEAILEIGCGLGDIAYRIACHWPAARVVALDTNATSIDYAKRLFRRPNLEYRCVELSKVEESASYGYVVMIDVYEHIPLHARDGFHASLHRVISKNSKVFFTCPTVLHQNYLRTFKPNGLQPVDEDVDFNAVGTFAEDIDARVVSFKEVSVWSTSDYLHACLEKNESWHAPVSVEKEKSRWLPFTKPSGLGAIGRGARESLVNAVIGKERYRELVALNRKLLGK